MLEDDGHGIEIEKVRRKAVSNGLISSEEAKNIPDSEALELIFHPGFSTVDQVSAISGRGLGMDAVRDTVQKIGGHVKIHTANDKGTSIAISLPCETEELLTPFTIYNLHNSMDKILEEYRMVTKGAVNIDLSGEEAIVFGDRWSVADQVRTVINELLGQSSQQAHIDIKLKAHEGRRRVDSHWFYRISFQIDPIEGLAATGLEINDRLKLVQSNLKRASGSLILRSKFLLELNLPSNIPVPFSAFEFPVLLVCDEPEKLVAPITGFFKNVMGGWSYDIITCRPGESLPDKLSGTSCIVVMDDHHAQEYNDMRSNGDREQDGVLLLTDEDTDLDNLEDLKVLPQNMIFSPRVFDSQTLDRALASIILRRFLKDMIRDQDGLSQRDLDKVSGFPS